MFEPRQIEKSLVNDEILSGPWPVNMKCKYSPVKNKSVVIQNSFKTWNAWLLNNVFMFILNRPL